MQDEIKQVTLCKMFNLTSFSLMQEMTAITLASHKELDNDE